MQNTTSFASANLQAATTRACQAPATVINFDDLPETGAPFGTALPASYENNNGLQFVGFSYVGPGASGFYPGYVNGVTSIQNDGFVDPQNNRITSAAGVFDLVSIQLSAVQ